MVIQGQAAMASATDATETSLARCSFERLAQLSWMKSPSARFVHFTTPATKYCSKSLSWVVATVLVTRAAREGAATTRLNKWVLAQVLVQVVV